MTSYPQATTAPTRWESRNGYVPPPRFQQLRALDNQQQQLQNQFNNQNQAPPPNQIQFPPTSSRGSESPQMTHARFPQFSFRGNKQSTDAQPSVHQRTMSSTGNMSGTGSPNQQYQPPPASNTFSAGPSPGVPGQPPPRQGQPSPQNIPPSQYGLQQQQPSVQPPAPFPSQPLPPQPPAPQQQQNKLQRPAHQRQATVPNMGHTANPSEQSVNSQPGGSQPTVAPPLHPEIRSVVQLTIAHAHKIYFSGPLVRRIERQPDGQKPHKDEGWTEVWAQLGGTTLSVWDMKEIQEASKQGKEVPPSYINITDAFVQVLGSVTVPATPTVPSKRYTNVLTLNTAGSNLLLFSCPSTAALISWAAALRLSAWEKSRLEEIYTAHLIRITLSARDLPTTLVRGKMEGWARIRIAGQTDWKRVWMSVQEGTEGSENAGSNVTGSAAGQASMKGKRMSHLFSRSSNSAPSSPMPQKPIISMFSSPKPKDRKKPLFTLTSITQAFGVYPERPELISKSTLIKVEGTFGDEEMAASLRTREGWTLIMPDLDNNTGQAAEMLKWVVALHDAFELYGRPEAWTWDPRDPKSLMFGYPVGPQKESLFIERELVETMDPRDDRTSVIRSQLTKLLLDNLKPAVQVVQGRPPNASDVPPSLPPVGGINGLNNIGNSGPPPFQPEQRTGQSNNPLAGLQLPQLPALSFVDGPSNNVIESRDRPLTPITERSSINTHGRTMSMEPPSMLSPGHAGNSSPGAQQTSNGQQGSPTILEGPMSHSPQSTSPTSLAYLGGANLSPSSTAIAAATPASTAITSQPPMSSLGPSPSLPRSPPTISPKPEETRFNDRTSPVPPSVSTSPGQASPNSANSPPSYPNFLVNETRSKTQDTVSSTAEVTSLEPTSDADQRLPSPKIHSPTWNQTSTSVQELHSTNTARSTPTEEPNDFMNEAGALFYMQQAESGGNHAALRQHIQQRHPQSESDDQDESDESESPKNSATLARNQMASVAGTSTVVDNKSQPIRRNTPMAFVDNTSTSLSTNPASTAVPPVSVGRLSPTRSGLGRKPSGARAQSSAVRSYNGAESISSQTVTEENMPYDHQKNDNAHSEIAYDDDANGEALAALSYLAIADSEVEASSASPRSPSQAAPALSKVEPLNVKNHDLGVPTSQAGETLPYKSSFAPSNKAAERKAKVQAQQAAHHAAVHKPGRANGKRKSRVAGAWESSDDDEEEEEEEEDDDDEIDSDGQKPMRGPQSSSSHQNLASSMGPGRPQIQTMHASQSEYQQDMPSTPSHLRPSRNLPQIPGGRAPTEDFHQSQPVPRRLVSDQYNDGARRTYYDDGTQIRSQSDYPTPGAARQTVWSQVLDPGRAPGRPDQQPTKDTFVQLEPAETMTKAFTPQGLLSAGLQDKEDRSAKRQEELARESGASLINVPNKPPPPQTGLLGAITAHERERKREGGMGAALTEREREKRLAEERQRRFDDHQRQQLDQMQQGGSMYGGQFGYNPMMNPMMMGMMGMNPMMGGGGLSPMMTGGGMAPMMTGQMGYPGMMGGFNPHMFAAQQAAQAYQQAMMAFSVAGSQVGGEGGGGGAAPLQGNNMNPSMSGMGPGMGGMNPAMTGSMAAFDPRMSMMGMPMMGSGMSMGGGMGMGMGMGMPPVGGQMGGQMPLGMQTTGMSNFDSRSSPGGANGSPSNMNDSGLLPPNQSAQFSSRTSSPAGRGSPLARGMGENVERGRPSRPTSPK